ncbi:hypothetical protein U1Q18_049988 [Sarracenia purpurea var. burkii]
MKRSNVDNDNQAKNATRSDVEKPNTRTIESCHCKPKVKQAEVAQNPDNGFVDDDDVQKFGEEQIPDENLPTGDNEEDRLLNDVD